MRQVTDKELLEQLNSENTPSTSGSRVNDPSLLAKLNNDSYSNKSDKSSTLRNVANALEQGIIGYGDTINNIPRHIYNLVMPQSAQVPILNRAEGLSGQIGKFAGDLTGLLAGGGVLNSIRGAAEALPAIGAVAKWLGGPGVAQTAARLGLGSGAYGYTTNPDHRVLAGLLEGGAGAAGGSIGAAIAKLLNPGLEGLGGVPIERIVENARIAGDTNTPLGNVLESRGLQRQFENKIAANPFSGAGEILAKNDQVIRQRGNDLVGKYLGNNAPEEAEQKIADSLMNAHEKQRILKNSLYKVAEDIADGKPRTEFKIDLPNGYSATEIAPIGGEAARTTEPLELTFPTFSKNIEKYNDLINEKTFLKFNPELKDTIKRVMDYSGDVTLKDANILAGSLKSLANKHGASPTAEDRDLARIFNELGSSLKDDIHSSIDKSGNLELKKAYNKAEKNYRENFVEFLDKDIYKFTHGGKSAEDIIQNFIKTGAATDKGELLSKLMSKLDPEGQDLVKYSYLSRAMRGPENDRQIDPKALRTLWSDTKLGQKQKAALFPDPAERKALDDYSKLTQMNTYSLDRLFNPSTGQRLLENSNLLSHGLGGLIGGGAGYYEGGAPGALVGTALGSAVPAILSRLMTNKITSPAYREKVIERLVGGNQAPSAGISQQIIPALIQRLLNQ